jgi:5-carboxymethyl-2-hydroxymuconic-semialdehyde dehydrogenase
MGEPVTEPQPLELPEKIEHFIGGRSLPSVTGGTFHVADPVSNKVYAHAAAGSAADVDRAAAAAREAFESGPWPGMAARARAKVLNRIADGI